MIDYYQVLGIPETATLDEIKKSYRKKSLQYHPDKTRDLPITEQASFENKMKLVNEAYGVLSDIDERRQYDDERREMKSSHSSKFFTLKSSGGSGDEKGREFGVSIYEAKDYVSGTSTIEVIVNRSNLVKFIDKFDTAVHEFETTIQKSSEKQNRILTKLDALCVSLAQNKQILSDPNSSSNQFLIALQKCAQLIEDLQADNEFNSHQVIAKTMPALLHVMHGIDILGNLFKFLIEKIVRISTRNAIPVFNSRNELSIGVFQSTNTNIFRAMKSLQKDMQWFSDGIEKYENEAFMYDSKWQGKKR